jgi:ribonuclease PH
LRAGLDLKALPAMTITLDCDVIQADGGTRTAAISGGYLALALALARALQAGEVEKSIFRAPVAAVSAGMVGGRALLDLDYGEDAAADVDANIVMNAAGEYIELQSTAEGHGLAQEDLNELLAMAETGIQQIRSFQAARLNEVGVKLDELWPEVD